MRDVDLLAERFDLATRAARIAIWEWSVETGELHWSPVFLEILGLDPSDFTGRIEDFVDRLVPEDREGVDAALTAHLERGTPYDIEYEMFRRDGHRVTIAAKGEVSRDDAGRPIRMVGTVQDVTERRKLEQQLLAAERIAGIGHWLFDLSSRTLVWSPETFRIHELDPEDGQPTLEEAFGFYHPEDVERVKQAFDRVVSDGGVRAVDVRLVLRDGSIRHVHVDGVATLGDDGVPRQLFGIVHDRTEMVKQAEQLRRSRRLETIGQLVGGVAHDFNNLLAVVEGNLEFLLEDEDARALPSEERLEILTGAVSAARRGAELTRSLLAFARKSHLEPRLVDVNEVVRETESWLTRALPASIEVRTRLDAANATARLDPTRLQSALVNVIVNARDAMPDGGHLTIETKRLEFAGDDFDAGEIDLPTGTYLELSVSDTGTGIPTHLLPRVFEPFVTSKEIGEGSGLGLSMVQGFVTQSGGFVRIDSTPGEGTTVKLFFPAVEAHSGEAGHTVEPEDAGVDAPPGIRILVAEDRLDVLNVVVRTLARAGYEVEAATDGAEALQRFCEAPDDFDLLLTDVVMPGRLSGPDLAEECRAANPDVQVIFMSGYAGDTTVHADRLQKGDSVLTKPIPRAELLDAVRGCLEAR